MTELLVDFGLELLALVFGLVFSFLGMKAKELVTKYVNTKEKKALAETTVLYVEQVFKDIHGQDKLNEALKMFSKLLAEKNIKVTDTEMMALIEAAVSSFNKSFEK